ncbi:MAG TPA: glycosyltransferase family 9 protein [Paenalcaligenes sp.]|nr:glycosyltransferase family 9 protein [Paenalcaligenes sp.]
MPTASSSSRTLLYVRLPNWLGDVCMCLPIIDALLESPQYELVICARPWAQQLLRHYPIRHWVLLKGHTRQDAKEIKKHRQYYDDRKAKGLIIPDSFSSAFIFWWGSIPSAGVRDEGRSFFLRWPFDKPDSSLHTVQYWYELARLAMQRWQTPIQPLHSEQLELRLPQSTQSLLPVEYQSGKTVLIAPTATGKHLGNVKIWPHFEALTYALKKRGIHVLMCPPPNEIEQAIANAPSAYRLEPLPIDQFAQLCQQVDLVVCNDSGVSHVAAAAQAKQITLFGVTSAARTGPWSKHALCLGELNRWPSLTQVLTACLAILSPESIAEHPSDNSASHLIPKRL